WIDIMEGEKDADCGADLGLITTTNPEGAGKWSAELNDWFRGRRVRIHEDNDDAGRKHVEKVAAALHGVAQEITVVRYPELAAGGDFFDFMDAGGAVGGGLARAKKTAAPPGYTFIRAPHVVPPKLDWMWEGHLLRGSLELLAGRPGMGKSQAQCSYVACATASRPWPDGAKAIPPCNVIMLTAEDNIEQILVPRLIAAGADLTRITILKSIRKDNKDRRFLLGE